VTIDHLRTAIAEGAPSLKPVEVHALAKKLESEGLIALEVPILSDLVTVFYDAYAIRRKTQNQRWRRSHLETSVKSKGAQMTTITIHDVKNVSVETKKLASESYKGHLTVLTVTLNSGRTERIELLSDEALGIGINERNA